MIRFKQYLKESSWGKDEPSYLRKIFNPINSVARKIFDPIIPPSLEKYKIYTLDNKYNIIDLIKSSNLKDKDYSFKKEDGYPFGTKFHYDNKNRFHNENGPAVLTPGGVREWWIHGERHRVDGPAVEGPEFREWWINNKRSRPGLRTLSGEEKWQLIEGNIESIEAIDSPTAEMQEYVIKKRPDLISKIHKLDSTLAIKYKDELDLSGLEI